MAQLETRQFFQRIAIAIALVFFFSFWAQWWFALFDQLFVGKSVSVDVGFDAYYLFLERGLLKNQGEQIGQFSKGFGN